MDVFYLLSIFPVSLSIIFIAMYIDSAPGQTKTNKPLQPKPEKEKDKDQPYEWNVHSFFDD